MPQGAKCVALKKSSNARAISKRGKGKTSRMTKAHSKKKQESNPRYKAARKPKTSTGLEAYKNEKIVTKKINANIEKVMAARVCQAGERLQMKDILSVGKEHSKELKRAALKRKKPRVEEKMEKFREKLDKISGDSDNAAVYSNAKRQRI